MHQRLDQVGQPARTSAPANQVRAACSATGVRALRRLHHGLVWTSRSDRVLHRLNVVSATRCGVQGWLRPRRYREPENPRPLRRHREPGRVGRCSGGPLAGQSFTVWSRVFASSQVSQQIDSVLVDTGCLRAARARWRSHAGASSGASGRARTALRCEARVWQASAGQGLFREGLSCLEYYGFGRTAAQGLRTRRKRGSFVGFFGARWGR